MKRKALITATAVLLVAVMCLATASYAWFTGGGSVGVEQFEFSVGGTDSEILLAVADMNDKYSAESWSTTLSLDDWSNDKGVVPLDAVNGDSLLTAVSTADGKNFFATDYANGIWTSRALNNQDSYLLLSFWVKPQAAGTATMKVSLANTDEKFEQSVKFGYALTQGTIGDVTNLGTFNTYAFSADNTDSYQAVTETEAKCVKNTKELFVPYTDNTDPENPVVSGGFADPKAQQPIPAAFFPITFADANAEETGDQIVAQLVTVAIWLEGMDKNCTGTWNLEDQKVNITFDWA